MMRFINLLMVNTRKLSTVCPLRKFSSLFLPAADFFQNQIFSKNSFRNKIKVSNSLDLDQARHFVGLDLGPKCLQKLSADHTRR